MKAPILDAAAIDLSLALHAALSAGQPVDLAVTAGRLALYSRQPERLDWAIPSLYLRAARAQLAEQPQAGERKAPPRESVPRVTVDDSLVIGQLDARQATFAPILKEGDVADDRSAYPAAISTKTRIGKATVDKFERAGVVQRAQGEGTPKAN
jgi:hypothetical protein